MSKVTQYYDGALAPLVIDADPGDPFRAWTSQRDRFRATLEALPEDAWVDPTRCSEWDVAALVRHLASGAQFLGYTLHKANAGVATSALRDLDTQVTPGLAASLLADLDRDAVLTALTEADANIAREAEVCAAADWTAIAEAPPGNVRAHLAVSHFLFDSWLHEYDVLLPRGERPPLDPFEAEVAARYVLGLAGGFTSVDATLDCRLTDLDVRLGLAGDGERVHVIVGDAPAGAPVIEGTVLDVLDRATGRDAGPVTGDQKGLALLDALAALLR